MSVGVGIGLVFLAREGISLASLRGMEPEQARDPATTPLPAGRDGAPAEPPRRVRARVPG